MSPFLALLSKLRSCFLTFFQAIFMESVLKWLFSFVHRYVNKNPVNSAKHTQKNSNCIKAWHIKTLICAFSYKETFSDNVKKSKRKLLPFISTWTYVGWNQSAHKSVSMKIQMSFTDSARQNNDKTDWDNCVFLQCLNLQMHKVHFESNSI